jgi:hypothetical protein
LPVAAQPTTLLYAAELRLLVAPKTGLDIDIAYTGGSAGRVGGPVGRLVDP